MEVNISLLKAKRQPVLTGETCILILKLCFGSSNPSLIIRSSNQRVIGPPQLGRTVVLKTKQCRSFFSFLISRFCSLSEAES